VSAQNAKDAADDFVARLRLPADVGKRKFQLVTFASDEDCRFFYPRRALAWQRQVNTYTSRALRERGIRVQRIAIAPTDYHAWRGDRPDTPELRREFADQHLQLLKMTA
jgi:hypothetical protein